MKRVAISTVEKEYLLANYGSFLQHYALREVVKALGLVPFRVTDCDERMGRMARCTDTFKCWLRVLYRAIRGDAACLAAARSLAYRNRLQSLFGRDYARLIGRFDEPQVYESTTIGILGGDQVFCRRSETMWLAGVPEGNIRLTYAASTNWMYESATPEWRSFVRNEASRFTALGLREQRGVEIVKDLLPEGLPIRQVADPVLLLPVERYRAMQSARRIFPRPTLFAYLVNAKDEADVRLEDLKALAGRLGCELKLCGIQGTERYVPRGFRAVLSPCEFLKAIDEVDYFVTNSFHGTVLAVLYGKRFVSLRQREQAGSNQNVRQGEFLARLGLESFGAGADVSVVETEAILRRTYDRQKVGERIAIFAGASWKWLEEWVSGV